MIASVAIPLPRDIPLPLPADSILLQALLVVLFLLHILFVNLMVGGSILAVVCEILGRRRADFDALAQRIAATVTVNKSLAVVLGIAPLLAINVLYTVYFYTANSLTGGAWISVVPLVIVAFLLTYLHKYTWEQLADFKGLHIALGAAGALLFLLIPLIFLANVNLMLFPAEWVRVDGFFSTLLLANVFPRYLHFVAASVAVAALFFVIYFSRAGFDPAAHFTGMDRAYLRRFFYGFALGASLLQLLFGPLLLMTLPSQGMSWFLILVITVGATCGVAAMVVMWREITRPLARPLPRLVTVVSLITLAAFCMGYGRHIYRENAVTDHRRQMLAATDDYGWAVAAAQWREATGQTRTAVPLGQKIFESTCAACHTLDRVLVGPAVREIAQLYTGNPAGIVTWTNAPGKKREGFPVMPAFKLGDDKLTAVANYMLALGGGDGDLQNGAGAGADSAGDPETGAPDGPAPETGSASESGVDAGTGS
jgi:cytochrome c